VIQEGFLGLFKALEHFDPARGVHLATYARFWIRAEIREYVVRQYRLVRIGTTKGERRALRLYRQTGERRPEVLASRCDLTPERAASLLPMLTAGDASLSAPAGADGLTLEAQLAHPTPSAEDLVAAARETVRLERAVATAVAVMDARLRAVVERRLLAEEPATLEELGASFGVSKERVRQLEVVAKDRLRRQLAPFRLADA
jgi:RNA polymerase sigma-32 factor